MSSVANYKDLLNLPKWLKVITSQLMQMGFLTQYAVAVEQLYNYSGRINQVTALQRQVKSLAEEQGEDRVLAPHKVFALYIAT